jgi:hypothetical protein
MSETKHTHHSHPDPERGRMESGASSLLEARASRLALLDRSISNVCGDHYLCHER